MLNFLPQKRKALVTGLLGPTLALGFALVICQAVNSPVALGQIQIGTIRGTAVDATGAAVPGATVALSNPISGFRANASTGVYGEFVFDNVPLNSYTLRITATGFRAWRQTVGIRSNIPVTLDIRLEAAGASETINVAANDSLVQPDLTSTQVHISQGAIETMPGATDTGKLQRIIATTPGWINEDNGLLHIRGVDDGILYVVDGIPAPDRADRLFAGSMDAGSIRQVDVLTGNIPAEFGGKSGAVVTIQPRSGLDMPRTFAMGASGGSFSSSEVEVAAAGPIGKKLGYFLTANASRSDRFLDPVDLNNYHNYGASVSSSGRVDWHPGASDILLFSYSVDGTGLQVSNTFAQQVAGQNQRQRLRDNSQQFMWQHTWSSNTVTNVAYYHRTFHASLLDSPFDTPLQDSQERSHTRNGVIASLSHYIHGHNIKAGAQGERITVREFFQFAVTDPDAADVADISDPALQFTPGNPFVFSNARTGATASGYVQDQFSPFKNFTINAGVRYDHSSLPVGDGQVSPRVGVVYYIAKTRTAIRASFNRLYMPPQIENLLLANSEQARMLSPFNESGGGATVFPEKTSAYEAGFAQDIGGLFKLDAAFWLRRFHNIDDPNVLFNTTIIFPNSVAEARGSGVDVRLDLKERKGWSAYFSYANSRILEIGPLSGGLFLTDDFIDAGTGVRFIPDHDQRNEGALGVTYHNQPTGVWASFSGHYNSGVPVQLDPSSLDQLMAQPNSDLVDFSRGRVKPWSVFNFSTGVDLFRERKVGVDLQIDAQNLANSRFAYNFGNPFSGTHFGYPRIWSGRVKLVFR